MGLRQRLKASTLISGLKGNRKLALVWVVVLVVGYPALYLTAVLPVPIGVAAAIALVYLAEAQASRRAPGLVTALRRAQLDTFHRTLIREGALVLFAVRLDRFSAATLGALGVGLLVLHVLRALVAGRLRTLDTLREPPALTRNVDLRALRIPDAPAAWFGRLRGGGLPYAGVPVAVGVVAAAFVPPANPFAAAVALAGLGASALGLAALAAVVVHAVRRNRHLAGRVVTREVMRRVHELRPEVIVYVSLPNEQGSAYQVDQWLPTLGRLPRRTLILVRERELVARIGPTPLPIVCLPAADDVFQLDLPDLRVVFYVNHAARNIHFLRLPTARHVFINHGDSDKAANVNRFSKVYDEVWVAGPAARDRHRLAAARLRDEELVEVGRPQVEGVRTARAEPADAPDRLFTILYAPTWEGISEVFAVSSVTRLGLAIIETLVDLDPAVRVIYKPHPFTGRRDPAVARASRRIATVLQAANQRRVRSGIFAGVIESQSSQRAAAAAELAELTRRIDRFANPTGARDAAQLARDSGQRDPADFAQLAAWEHRRERLEWEQAGWWAHRTVTGTSPDLISCFNQADVLIGDISAVVSDFVASGKPYVMTNLTGLSEEEYRETYTAARGAYVLSGAGSDLPRLIGALRQPGDDELAARRRELRRYLLGPAEPDPLTRFIEALQALFDPTDQVRLGGPLAAVPAARSALDDRVGVFLAADAPAQSGTRR